MKLNEIILEGLGQDMVGVHFSNRPNLTKLNASKHGTGIAGAEAKRRKEYPETYIHERIYFYDKNQFKRKEPGLGAYRYEAKLKNVYDMHKDPLRIRQKAKERVLEDSPSGIAPPSKVANVMEQIVVENGYNGYTFNGVIIYFDDVRVTPIDA